MLHMIFLVCKVTSSLFLINHGNFFFYVLFSFEGANLSMIPWKATATCRASILKTMELGRLGFTSLCFVQSRL